MSRFLCGALVAMLVLGSSAAAQQSVPPAAPTIGASAGGGAGIAVPIGSLADTHTAGYTISGIVDFSAADQPYSFRTELIFQRYDKKGTAPVGTRNMNITSLGASLLARSPNKVGSSG